MSDYASIEEGPGSMVGRYKLLQKIGEGGCGIVYMAEQEEPVRRRVALKIIKLGMDTRQVVARFEAERQALAMMDHPNIARVFDAGATETGRPYFVMELVRGIRITEYCDQNHLSTRERLDLFIKTAHAIQHAHQKGIIHRDIKPSNVLVTLHDGVPVPKVIDFGIAKATEQRLTDKTLFTQFEQFIGTPAYTSPEQAEMSGLDIDTRTDIYALGVLLYELLVGRTPFDQKELLAAGLDEMRRTIREVDPVKPSTRLTQGLVAADVRRLTSNPGAHDAKDAEKVRASSRRLLQEIQGDLDWIVMKCLEKDRTRRYETASGLAADIRHYLGNEPVTARPPGNVYKFGKLVRRNKLACAAVAAVAMVLIIGLIVSMGHAARARRAQEVAKSDGDAARAVMDFFRHQVLAPFRVSLVRSAQNAGSGQDEGAMRRKAIETAESRIAGAFKDRQQVEADIRSTLGASYSHIKEHALAARQHEAALALFKELHGPRHPRTIECMCDLGKAYHASEGPERKRAVPLLEEALGLQQQASPGSHTVDVVNTMGVLGRAYLLVGSTDKALNLSEEVLKCWRAQPGPDLRTTLVTMHELGWEYLDAGEPEPARRLLEEVVARTRGKPDGSLWAPYGLGYAHRKLGNHDQAIPLMKEALILFRGRLGPDQGATIKCTWDLVSTHREAGKIPELEEWFREELGRDPAAPVAQLGLSVLLMEDAGRSKEAQQLLHDYLAGVRKRNANNPHQLEDALNEVAQQFYGNRRFAMAESLYRESLASAHRRRKAGDPRLLYTADLARVLSDRAWDERDNPVAAEVTRLAASDPQPSTFNPQLSPLERAREAEQLLLPCLAPRPPGSGTEEWEIPDVKSRFGSALVSIAVTDPALSSEARLAEFARAEPYLLEGHEELPKVGPDSVYRRDALVRLVRLYEAWKKPDQRAEWQEKLDEFDRKKQPKVSR